MSKFKPALSTAQGLLLYLGVPKEKVQFQSKAGMSGFWYSHSEYHLQSLLEEAGRLFKKRILQAHPDRGGTHEEAATVISSWQCLKKIFEEHDYFWDEPVAPEIESEKPKTEKDSDYWSHFRGRRKNISVKSRYSTEKLKKLEENIAIASDKQLKYLELLKKGLHIRRIASLMGTTRHSVTSALTALANGKKSSTRVLESEKIKKMESNIEIASERQKLYLKHLQNKLKISEIAYLTGSSASTVSLTLDYLAKGKKFPAGRRTQGVDKWKQCNLQCASPFQRKIYDMLGVFYIKEIAKKLGCSREIIFKALNDLREGLPFEPTFQRIRESANI